MHGSSALVQSVVKHSIYGNGFTSVIARNISTVCNLFGWSPGDFIRGKVSVYDDNRLNHKFRQGLSDHENAVAEFVKTNLFYYVTDIYICHHICVCQELKLLAQFQ